jgi:alkylhydroperoxidase family enzyme
VTRIPSHTIEDAPEASRPLLQNVIQFSPTGRPLNLHAQMAHSPAVLAAYSSIRQATDAHGTLDFPVRSALMLATAGASHSEYAEAVTATLAERAGWSKQQVSSLRDGGSLGDEKIDAIVGVVREAAAHDGRVGDLAWERATSCGWTAEELAEAFAYLGLTVFTAYFLNYARTELDLQAPARATTAAQG